MKLHTKSAEGALVSLPADMNIDDFRQKLNSAVNATFPAPTLPGSTMPSDQWIKEYTLTYCIVDQGGDEYKIDYAYDVPTGTFTLGQKVKVVAVYVAAESAVKTIRAKGSESLSGEISADQLTEKGMKWKVQLISSGRTSSPNADLAAWNLPGKRGYRDYTPEAITGAVNDKLFENALCIIRSDADHLAYHNSANPKGIQEEQVNGVYRNSFVTKSAEGVTAGATLELRNNRLGRAMRDFLQKRASEGTTIPYDLSITCEYDGHIVDPHSQNPTIKVTRITQVDSADPVLRGNAGGHIFKAAEALNKHKPPKIKMDKKLIKALAKMRFKAAEADVEGADAQGEGTASMPATLIDFAAQFVWDNLPGAQSIFDSVDDIKALDEAKLVKLWSEADATDDASGGKPDVEPTADATDAPAKAAEVKNAKASEAAMKSLEDKLAALELQNTQNSLTAKLSKSNLTEPSKEVLIENFKGKKASEADIDTAIRSALTLESKLTKSMNPMITFGEDSQDKLAKGVMNFFFKNATPQMRKTAAETLGYDPSETKYDMFRSVKTMYQQALGIPELGTGFGENSKGRASEAYDAGQITQLALDALNVRARSEFLNPSIFDAYRKVSKADSVSDFRASHDEGYGFMATSQVNTIANSGDTYQEMALTGNENITTTLVERGGLFSINWRDIVNDRTGQIQELPGKIAQAYLRHINKGVMDLLWNAFSTTFGATGYNAISTDLKNTSTDSPATISATRIVAARNTLLQTPQLGSNEALGIPPKYVIHMTKDFGVVYKTITPGAQQQTAGSPATQGNLVATADQSFGLENIEVPHWDGYGTFNRWFLLADPALQTTIKTYYYNGIQEPQIFQEVANTGANFTAKQLRFRSEFHWAANIVNYRGIYGEKVS